MANSTLIGTMNMLGDAYNPFEFLAVDDAKFMNVCESFEARARAVTWADLDAQGLNELIEACGGAVADRKAEPPVSPSSEPEGWGCSCNSSSGAGLDNPLPVPTLPLDRRGPRGLLPVCAGRLISLAGVQLVTLPAVRQHRVKYP